MKIPPKKTHNFLLHRIFLEIKMLIPFEILSKAIKLTKSIKLKIYLTTKLHPIESAYFDSNKDYQQELTILSSITISSTNKDT